MADGNRRYCYKLVVGRDINVISPATAQLSGIPDPFPSVPTLSDFGEQHQVQTGSRKVHQTGSFPVCLRKLLGSYY